MKAENLMLKSETFKIENLNTVNTTIVRPKIKNWKNENNS